MTLGKAEAEVVLRLDGITKRFGALTANDAVSLTLRRGEVVALLGENGAGKTTLMNILFGHYVADDGSVEVFGTPLPPGNPRAALAAGVGMVHQHFTLAGNLTVLDNIRLGTEALWSRSHTGAREKVERLSRDFGLAVHPDAKVGRLSVGERQRVEILKALYRDARILILDEPTAVLTPQEAEALFATLRKATALGLSVIFISHKLHEVMAIADRCVVLRHGRVVGEVDTHTTDKGALAALMVGGELSLPRAEARAPGAVLMRLDAVGTPDRGAMPGLKSVTLDLRAGQITGLAGVSGNGQAALAEIVGGLALPVAGRVILKDTAVARWSPGEALAQGVARIPEDRHHQGSIADFSLTENAVLEGYRTRFSRRGWMNWRAARTFAEGIIKGYDVRCPGPDTRIRLLSGGNMQKLILGRAMASGPQIILANQPVRGLDVGAIAYVQSQLIAARDRGAAVLLISEDLDEIMGLSDVIHVMSQGRLSPGFARGTMTAADLGLWMAGQKFEDADAA
ncbi:MAG: ABC transporter ATP-binding protein [Tabrizicola sp.]|uniref:ABC transporter ATP-binding protein n=1 Tax=Tabrizicola sp. TaxID=2005166 RepID=UPI002AB96603|nr:ABC transporter ATP-binding protein [Tabrizicola sp.]MDZ4086658.1 ABC transporter ATP-binding protein [Tabrizicola sp.]